jgi:hypothetical protein
MANIKTNTQTYADVATISLGGMLMDITEAGIHLSRAHDHINEFLIRAEEESALPKEDRARLIAVLAAIEDSLHPKVIVVRDHLRAARESQRVTSPWSPD